jgi:hypothetical protein
MTSKDRCYNGAPDTSAVADSAHSSDGSYDISRPLLLPPTIGMDSMTSDDHCYCGACGTREGATSDHNTDGCLTSADHCYDYQQWWQAVWHQRTIATTTHSSERALWHQTIIATVGHVERARFQLAPTIVTGHLTVATGGHVACMRYSNISGPSLLASTAVKEYRSIATGLPAATCYLISVIYRYWTA